MEDKWIKLLLNNIKLQNIQNFTCVSTIWVTGHCSASKSYFSGPQFASYHLLRWDFYFEWWILRRIFEPRRNIVSQVWGEGGESQRRRLGNIFKKRICFSPAPTSFAPLSFLLFSADHDINHAGRLNWAEHNNDDHHIDKDQNYRENLHSSSLKGAGLMVSVKIKTVVTKWKQS